MSIEKQITKKEKSKEIDFSRIGYSDETLLDLIGSGVLFYILTRYRYENEVNRTSISRNNSQLLKSSVKYLLRLKSEGKITEDQMSDLILKVSAFVIGEEIAKRLDKPISKFSEDFFKFIEKKIIF